MVAAFILVLCCVRAPLGAQLVLRTSGLEIGLGGRGEILRLTDPRSGTNYAPEGRPGCLVRVKTGGREIGPSALRPG
jgi:hypothetical protein